MGVIKQKTRSVFKIYLHIPKKCFLVKSECCGIMASKTWENAPIDSNQLKKNPTSAR